jgi:hypothetical protein
MADRAPRLRRHTEAVLVEPQPTPVLGIDETRPAGDQGLLGQREGLRVGRYSIEELSSELGEVISGQTAGRTSDNDFTIAKFVGIARKTFVAAEVMLARLTGIGRPRVSGILQEGGKARPAVRRRRTSPDAGRHATRGAVPAPGVRQPGDGRQDPVAGTASECSQP